MIGLVTIEDLQELGKEIDIIKGNIAELDNKLNELIAELNEKVLKKPIKNGN